MRKTRFTETQIVSILREHDAGASFVELGRRHGVHPNTISAWKAKYGESTGSIARTGGSGRRALPRRRRLAGPESAGFEAVLGGMRDSCADTDRHELAPEAAGLYAIATGFQRLMPQHFADDDAMLAAETPMYDALYEYCRASLQP